MAKIKSIDDTVRNYVKKSLMTFVEGGKYTKDKKPQSLNWIIGVIEKSGVKREVLKKIFGELQNYPRDEEEKSRLDLVLRECHKQGLL